MSSSSSRPGRAQVHVGVDEGGEGVQALGVHHLRPLGRLEAAGRADLGHRPVAQDQVARAVEPGTRVEQVRARDQHRRARCGLAVEHVVQAAHAGLGCRGLGGQRAAALDQVAPAGPPASSS